MKLSCVHIWEVVKEYTEEIPGNDVYQRYITVYQCKKCGETKYEMVVAFI